MEDRYNVISRWLVALTVVFIPLSLMTLITGTWGANYIDAQWTRYLLFASWIALTLSLIVGAGNMLTFMADTSGRAKKKAAALDVPTEEQEEIVESVEEEASSSMGASLVLVQVSTFLLGMILYVTFISWMLLPEIIVGGF
jgi:ABC-type transporter Mla maintaining outer membrane lipid asymmetry permease subunit MlaE